MKKITLLLLALMLSVTTWATQWKAGDAQTPVAGTDYLVTVAGNLLTSGGKMTSTATDRTYFWQLEDAGDGNYYVKNDNGYISVPEDMFTAITEKRIGAGGWEITDCYDYYNYAGFNASLVEKADASEFTLTAVTGGYNLSLVGHDGYAYNCQGTEFGIDNYGAATVTFCTAEEYVPFTVENGNYTFKNLRSSSYATWTGDATQMSETSLTIAGVWTITANGDGSYKLGNHETTNYYAGVSSFTAEGAKVYIDKSAYNDGYVVVSLSSDFSSNCWDDQGGSTKVGYWYPSASDNQGTSWLMTAITDEEIEALIPETPVEFVAPIINPVYVPSVSTTKATTIESGKFYVVKGYNQANAAAVAYLYNNSGSIKGNTGTPTFDDNYVWYVQKRNNDIFYMYNMSQKKFLAVGSSNGATVSFADADAYVQFTAGDAGVFAIKNSTCDKYIDFSWAGTDPTTWGGGCTGSRRAEMYEVEYVDPTIAARATLLAAINAAKDQIGSNPGWKASADIMPLVEEAELVYLNSTATETQINDATTTLNGAVDAVAYIMPTEGKLYYVISALPNFEAQQGVRKAMYANGTQMSWKTLSDEDASMIWNFTASGTGYAMLNNFTSSYPGVQASQSAVYPTSTEATVVTLTALGNGQFNMITAGSGYAMHTGGHSSGAGVSGNIVGWNNGISTGSAWYIEETDADEAALAKATFATIQKGYTPFNVADDEEVVKAQEIGDIATIDAAINAVNAIDPETATVAEMGACYAANAATINSLSAYGTLTNIKYTLKPGFCTMCLPCWGKASDDTFQAYTCTGLEDGSQTTLALTESATMAPKTPFLVQNKTAENINFRFIGWNKATDGTTQFESGSDNELVLIGTIAEDGVVVANGNYVVQKQKGVTAFYKVTDEYVTTCPQYHCYLVDQRGDIDSPEARFFGFPGTETAISNINALTSGKTMIYDLSGRRFNSLQKGINIVNGQKVLVK